MNNFYNNLLQLAPLPAIVLMLPESKRLPFSNKNELEGFEMAGNIIDALRCEIEQARGVLSLMVNLASTPEGKTIRLGDKGTRGSLWAMDSKFEGMEKLLDDLDTAN